MFVVHGLVTGDGGLACWAETAPGGPVARRTSLRRAVPHPFAVPPPLDGPAGTAELQLPSAGSSPIGSPELGARRPARGAVRVLPWTVPVVHLPAGGDPEALFDDVPAGSSIGYLGDVARFAADLVRRGRVLPLIVDASSGGDSGGDAGGGYEARWRTVLTGPDQSRFETLWRAMPGVARAATPGRGAAEATRRALDSAADALVRRKLHGPLLAPPATIPGKMSPARAPEATTPGKSWPNRPPEGTTSGKLWPRSSPEGTGSPKSWPKSPEGTGSGELWPRSGLEGTGSPELWPRGGPEGTASAVRAWVDGLTGDDPALTGDGEAIRTLRQRLDRWAASGRAAPLRTCFRLSYVDEYPGEDAGGWLLEFLLQPLDEPSLLVPASQVWRDVASPLMRWADDPQEILLADLGRACRLYPDLEDVLRTAYPAQERLDLAGAYRFLTHANVLEDAGFGVLVPSVWQRRQDLGLTLTVRTGQPASPVLRDTTANRDAIVQYRWGLAIGAEFLSEHDLVELARAKVPLVRLRGRWVHLDRERLRAGLAFLARGGSGEMTAGEAMRLTRLVPESDLPLPVTGVDGSGWLADLLTGRAVDRLELIDPPASLLTELRPYQRKGLSWLVFLDRLGVGALLADDMGLGKTVQVLALEALQREAGPRPPTLIVCPMSVLGNWRREIERFTPSLSVHVHHGPGRARPASVDLVLTTYQLAARDTDLLAAVAWDRIVLDEAQHVKNATAGIARAVRRIPARHRVALTGTPVENRLTELWSIAEFLNPGLLGPASIFRARYSVPIERFADPDAAARLRRVTRPFLLRRVKTDKAVIADLPEKFERRQWCNLTVEQATLYRAVVDEMFIKLKEGRAGSRRKALVLSAMTKLKQVCNHPAHLLGDGTPLAGRSGKLERLEEILANALADGDRALVFTQFARFGAMLAPYLAERLGTEVAFLHGGTAKGARDAMVARFQESGPDVLLLSLKAGGTGLNLTAANHVVHLDRWWNPATEAQATDRAYRIGQRRDVQVHTFVCVGTVEERIDGIMAEKRALARSAVGSGEGWLAGLSTDDLLDLVTLTPEAVGG